MDITRTKEKEVKLFEAFAGIGSQYKALKNIAQKKNWKIKSTGIIEWFIPAIIAYQAIHFPNYKIKKEKFDLDIVISNDSKTPISSKVKKQKYLNETELGFWINRSKFLCKNFFDINLVKGNDIPKNIDIFTYSFPCQDISNQGKQKGFDKSSNTRSGLLWEIERILFEMKRDHLPKYLLLENVKSILNYKHKENLLIWLGKLNELGYENKIYSLNSINFNSPQNRQRVFVLSVLKSHKEKSNFVFPDLESYKSKNKKTIKSILSKSETFNDRFNDFKIKKCNFNQQNNIQKYKLENYTNFQSENFVYDVNFSGPTLTASGAMSRIKLYFKENQIREMNACEALKYMGFDDEDYKNVKNIINPNKLIYLSGNSIPVEVLEKIFECLRF